VTAPLVYVDTAYGLPVGYGWLSLASTAEGHHYDYTAQKWQDGNDHAHLPTVDGLEPLYCGADLATCQQRTVREITRFEITR